MIKNDVFARANEGDAKSQALVAYEYYKELNYTSAVRWANASAAQDNEQGLYLLGIFYWNGYGVEKDYNRAVYYLRRSAGLGYVEAHKILDRYNIPLQEPQAAAPEPAPTGRRKKDRGAEQTATQVVPTAAVQSPRESLHAVGMESAPVGTTQRIQDYRESLDNAPEQRKQYLKQKAREERARAKRKKKRRRMAKTTKIKKVFNRILLCIFLVVILLVGAYAAITYIPFGGTRGVWNTYTKGLNGNDLSAIQSVIYVSPDGDKPMDEVRADYFEEHFQKRFGDELPYIDRYSAPIFSVMLPAKTNETGTKATADVFIYYGYSVDGETFLEQGLHKITVNFVIDADGKWWLKDEYQLRAIETAQAEGGAEEGGEEE